MPPKGYQEDLQLFDSPMLNKIIEYNDYLRDDLDKFLINLESSKETIPKKGDYALGTSENQGMNEKKSICGYVSRHHTPEPPKHFEFS